MADELSDAFDKLAKVVERASLGGDLTGVKEAWIKADNEFVKAVKKCLDAWKEARVRADIEEMISEGVLPAPSGELTISEIELTPIMHNTRYKEYPDVDFSPSQAFNDVPRPIIVESAP